MFGRVSYVRCSPVLLSNRSPTRLDSVVTIGCVKVRQTKQRDITNVKILTWNKLVFLNRLARL